MTSNDHAVVDALAEHIAREGFVSFTEMNEFLKSRGVDLVGHEALTGEHLRLPHVLDGTTLFGPVSNEYVEIVQRLFAYWPVTLMIGDPATFRTGEEPWYVDWVGGPQGGEPWWITPTGPSRAVGAKSMSLPRRPAVNRDVHDIADRAKHGYATATRTLADMQCRLAELAGIGRLGVDESKDLQQGLQEVWWSLYAGTLCAVRDSNTHDTTWDEADNTYSDGRTVIHKIGAEISDTPEKCWEHSRFMLGDGAPQEFPRGTISYIEPVRSEKASRSHAAMRKGSLAERLQRHRRSGEGDGNH